MRVGILTPYYPPEMGAPPARLHEIATRLVASGDEVTVITAYPSRPLGRIYPGYGGRPHTITVEDGVRVIRTWIRPSAASASFIGRAINDLSFTWTSGWTIGHRIGRLDVLIVQNPPLFSVFNARAIARRSGARIIMWCGDIWPDVLIQSGQMRYGLLARIMRANQQLCFNSSALLAVTNPTIAEETRRSYHCPPIAIWSNGVDTRRFAPEKADPAVRAEVGARPEDILVGYIGLHGRFQGLDAIVDAAIALKDSPGFRFVFIGEGVEKPRLVERARQAGAHHITFCDPRPKKVMPALVASCDISVVSLLTRMPGTMPSKFYEACASGSVPLVADGCEAAPLVRQHGAGLVYEPGDPRSAKQALLDFRTLAPSQRQRMSSAARMLSLRFDRDVLASHLRGCLLAVHEGRPLPEQHW